MSPAFRRPDPAVPGSSAPSPVAPNPILSQPSGTMPNYRPAPVAPNPILSQPSGTVPNYPISSQPQAASPSSGGYNPNTTYPGPYGNNADNYKVWLNNQNSGMPSTPNTATDPNAAAGSSPYMALATGNGPTGSFSLNPQNFATPAYAQSVAKQLGGTVVPSTGFAPSSPFYANQPQQLINLPNGSTINPAVLAQLYSHGYGQSYVNGLVQNYTNGADAYNPNVQNTLGQNAWGFNTNAPVNAAQSFQAGTTPNAQVLAQNPGSIPQGFLGPGQTTSSNPGTYTQPNPNAGVPTAALQTPNQNTGANGLGSLLSFLSSPQIQQLYGGNPFSLGASSLGSGNLANLLGALSSQGGGNNLTSIAALLNLFASGQQYSNNSNLNPLFFNNTAQASPGLYYPQFY